MFSALQMHKINLLQEKSSCIASSFGYSAVQLAVITTLGHEGADLTGIIKFRYAHTVNLP